MSRLPTHLPRQAPLGPGEWPWWAEPGPASQWWHGGREGGRARAEGRSQRGEGGRTEGQGRRAAGQWCWGAGRDFGAGPPGGGPMAARGRGGRRRAGARGGGGGGGGEQRGGGRGRPSGAERSRAGPSRAGPGPGARGRCGRPGGGWRTPEPLAPGAAKEPRGGTRPRRPARHGRGQLRGALVGEPPAPATPLRPALGDHQQPVPARGHRLPAGDAAPRVGGQGPSVRRSEDSQPPHSPQSRVWGGPPLRGSPSPPVLLEGHGLRLLVSQSAFLLQGCLLRPGAPLCERLKTPILHGGSMALLQILAFSSGVT